MDTLRMETPAGADEIRAILQEAVQSLGTQKDLARYLGYSQKHVSQMLTGQAGMSLDNLFGILDYVGMTLILAGVAYAGGMESEEKKSESPLDDKTSGRLKEMYRAQESERTADYPYAEPNPSGANED